MSARLPAVAEVVTLASELIRIDTTNTGDPSTVVGERAAAEYVAEKLAEVGYQTTYVESGAKGRGNVVARRRGPTRAAARCSCTGIWMWCPRTRRSGRCTRSPARSPTVTCGVAARST